MKRISTQMAPQRALELEGGHNVRDLGGYHNVDGRTTKWRTYLRSARLDELSPTSRDTLVELGLSSVVDLRFVSEVKFQPSVFEGSSDPSYVHIDMVGERPDPPLPPPDVDIPERTAWTYCQWLGDSGDAISRILGALAEAEGMALYNCAAGKDRTGVISALLLGLADVPDETIVGDYALSATYLWPRDCKEYRERNGSDSTLEDFQQEASPAEAMQLTLQHLNQEYGGIRSYVESIGVCDERVARICSKLLG